MLSINLLREQLLSIVAIIEISLIVYSIFVDALNIYLLPVILGGGMAISVYVMKNGRVYLLRSQTVFLAGCVVSILISSFYEPDAITGPFEFYSSWSYILILTVIILSIVGSVVAGKKPE